MKKIVKTNDENIIALKTENKDLKRTPTTI